MLELKDINIDDKEMFNRYLKRKCSKNSEFTFTNFYMWRKSYDMKYAIIDDMLCIMPQHAGGPRSATFPIGFIGEDGKERDVRPVIERLMRYFEETNQSPLLRLYDEQTVQKLIKAFPGRFLITEDVNYEDYVYDVQQLINLSGKKFHGKKNHVNKFKKTYDWEYQRMTPDNKEECIELFDAWSRNKEIYDEKGFEEELEAVHELINNWEKLDIVGGCIRVGGEMVAFSFGEPLCKDMAVIHLEHANTDYQGSFAIMNQQFLEHEWSEYRYVNREEDMGIEGLRKAKQSYRPVMMVKKYVATPM